MEMLSKRQREYLDYLEKFSDEHGYPPTYAELAEGLNAGSKAVVAHHLNQLAAKGLLKITPNAARGIKLSSRQGQKVAVSPSNGHIPVSTGRFRVPVVGTIAGGLPLPVLESDFALRSEEFVELTRDVCREEQGLYALHVKGNSMIDALIHDGDVVVMRPAAQAENGEMVAVWLADTGETTLKRFYREGEKGERVRLQPENRDMSPIYVDASRVRVQGRVVAVVRRVA
ncbi:MAG: repressor LexA [Chloroflexi bacterium]|nr:repressor LexA [Chloroflexota bacterium]